MEVIYLMDEVLIKIMRLLAICSLPYMLQGLTIHVKGYQLVISGTASNPVYSLNGKSITFEGIVDWVMEQSLLRSDVS